jgi:hypothetical protein
MQPANTNTIAAWRGSMCCLRHRCPNHLVFLIVSISANKCSSDKIISAQVIAIFPNRRYTLHRIQLEQDISVRTGFILLRTVAIGGLFGHSIKPPGRLGTIKGGEVHQWLFSLWRTALLQVIYEITSQRDLRTSDCSPRSQLSSSGMWD